MITILRAYGLPVVIYRDDHLPPHVHVVGDGEIEIELVAGGAPRVISIQRMKASDVRKALQAVTEHQDMLLQMWSKFHG